MRYIELGSPAPVWRSKWEFQCICNSDSVGVETGASMGLGSLGSGFNKDHIIKNKMESY